MLRDFISYCYIVEFETLYVSQIIPKGFVGFFYILIYTMLDINNKTNMSIDNLRNFSKEKEKSTLILSYNVTQNCVWLPLNLHLCDT